MAPARRWNLADFALVVEQPSTTAALLQGQLGSRRRLSDIEALRDALHAYHGPVTLDRSGVSRVGLYDSHSRLLSQRRGTLVCARCAERY